MEQLKNNKKKSHEKMEEQYSKQIFLDKSFYIKKLCILA